MQLTKLHRAVIQTLCYADIFDYPLTFSEISRFLIGIRATEKEIQESLTDLHPIILKRGQYYYLLGKKNSTTVRKKRTEESQEKLLKAYSIAYLLGKIPTILSVSLSGSLAMMNADIHDDIDFFIITKPHSLWLSRCFATFLLFFMGEKRTPGTTLAKDKICLNMWMTSDALVIPHHSRNLYTAHEILQGKPIIEKKDAYVRFIAHNGWVKTYLPNRFSRWRLTQYLKKDTEQTPFIIRFADTICYYFQKVYMMRKKRNETVKKSLAQFHPRDVTYPVLSLYRMKVKFILQSLANGGKNKKLASNLPHS